MLHNKSSDVRSSEIGVEPGIIDFIPEIPKGIHRSIFYKTVHEIQRLELFGDQAMVKKMGKDLQ
jgi:hypothetical protein